MLTAKQRQLVEYIDAATLQSGGVCPSYQEMADAIGVKTRSSITRLIDCCEERGAIQRLPGLHRAIAVVRLKPRVKWFRFDDEDKVLKPLD